MDWEAVIGLEVHAQLSTASKLFCRCPNRFGGEPNSRVCPVCLGYPGALPVLNGEAVRLAVKIALAIGCTVHQRSVFARKNYFYADLPKGYQISQFEDPLAEWGSIPLARGEGRITVRRLHLEEDAGKLLHETPGGGALPGQSLVDFNRCGVPLVEIVSEPELHTPDRAQEYLHALHQLLRYTETSDGNLEEGSLRCDANISLRPRGESALGTRVEIKNLNSFRNVGRALEHEIDRQAAILEQGGEVVQETRSFEAASGTTKTLRGKEEAHDYRYFPDPDLRPLVLAEARLEQLEQELPELPWARRRRLVEQLGLPVDDAEVVTSSRQLADYFEEAVGRGSVSPKTMANWVMTDVLRELKSRRAGLDAALPAARLARLVDLVDQGEISTTAAKQVFGIIWESGEEPAEAVDRLGLRQVGESEELRLWIATTLAENPRPVEQLRAGKDKVLGFLVGQVMRKSGGRADPQAVRRLVHEAALEGATSTPT